MTGSLRLAPFTILALAVMLIMMAQPAYAWQADRPSHDVTCSNPPGPICPWTFSYDDQTQDPLGAPVDHNSYSPSGDAGVALSTEAFSYQQNYDHVTNRDDYSIRIMASANSRQSHVMPAPTYHGWSSDPNQCASSSPSQGCTDAGLNTQNGGVWVNLPFTFFHYGQAYNSVFVCSNGYTAFAFSKTSGTCPTPPTGAEPQMFGSALDSNGNILGIPSAIIAPYMKALNAGWQNAKIYYRNTVPSNAVLCPPACGSPPGKIFGVSWYKLQEQNAQIRSDCWPCENTFSLILDQYGNIWFWWDSNTFNPFGGGSSQGVIGVNDGSGTMSTLGDRNSAQTSLGLNMRDTNYPAADPNHTTPPANQYAWLNDLKITFDDPNTADTLNPTGRGGLYGHNIQSSPPPQTCDNTCKAEGTLVENGIVIGLCATTGFVCIAVTAADIAYQLGPYIGSMPAASFGSQQMNNQCPSGQTLCTGYVELPTKQDDGLCNCATDASALLLLVDWIVPHDMNAHVLTVNFGAELGQYSGGLGFGDTSHTRGWARTTLSVDAGDFQFNSVTPQTSNSVVAGQSLSYNVNIGLNSQAQSLTTIGLSTAVSGPTGGTQPTITFSPTNTVVLNGGQSGSVTLTITTTTSTPIGTYSLTLTGEDPTHALMHSTTFSFTVVTPQDFTVSANPASISMNQYECWTSTISVSSAGGFGGPVTLQYSSFPQPSIISSFNGCWGSQGSMTVTVPSGGTATTQITFNSCQASPGTYPITITATSSSPVINHQTTITVNVLGYGSSCGGSGGGSLAHGTLITMADGSQTPVQNLKVGDQLQGYDSTTGQYETSTVLSIATKHATNMLIINTATGTPIRVDASQTEVLWTRHPDGTTLWLPAPMLAIGDDLWTPNGWVPITSINYAPAGNHTMYDITATVPYFANGYLDPPHPS